MKYLSMVFDMALMQLSAATLKRLAIKTLLALKKRIKKSKNKVDDRLLPLIDKAIESFDLPADNG